MQACRQLQSLSCFKSAFSFPVIGDKLAYQITLFTVNHFAKYHFAKYQFAKYHFVSFRFVSQTTVRRVGLTYPIICSFYYLARALVYDVACEFAYAITMRRNNPP